MGEKTNDQKSELSADAAQAEAERLVAEIKQFRVQAEEQFKAAELSRKNADSEGLFAINAKKTCEDHATAISQIKGNVESEANTIKANKQTSDELLAALTTGKAAIDAQAKVISDQQKQAAEASKAIEAAGTSCSTKVQEIEKLKSTGDGVLKEISDALAKANKAELDTEDAKKKAVDNSKDCETNANTVEETLAKSKKQYAEIDTLLKSSQTDEATLKDLFEHLKKSDSISNNHETNVAKLRDELELLIKRVDHLLPGATSASLASSFSTQKTRFSTPQKGWLKLFIGCIIGLIIIALPSFLAALGIPLLWYAPDMSLKGIARSLLLRLPIVIPLVWLAIYAGRNYMLSLRLEEEYAYKEAVSTAFEGYKRELSGIPISEGEKQTPLNQLCDNVLAAIAERPGQIYEGKHKDITIVNEAHGAANELKEIAKQNIATR